MVTFHFLSQNVRRWQGPINSTLSFNECRLSEGDTKTQITVIEFV